MSDTRIRKIGTLSIQYTKSGFIVWETACQPNQKVHTGRVKSRPGNDQINAQNGAVRAWLRENLGIQL
jgi:hypothetical protein